MTDVFSLKLAIYFVGPLLLLYAATYLTGAVLTLVSSMVVDRELSLDSAMQSMVIVICATTFVASIAHWSIGSPRMTLAFAVTSFFFAGGLVYSYAVEDYTQFNEKRKTKPIGISKGFLVSGIYSILFAALTMFAIWVAGVAR
ncbi:hypothetical protein [Crateriforma conspicua]|uniref:hypothetical protein n=1 Tax=Crateriforma conspicua TaxID=2527996 RepID=UPI00118AB05F|nr:hypothetical protein [Crateriforma conspicua]QDV61083.1 hypothetical protein Mal65_02060 [Crateriforma conspicua]QDV61123.1 hypothetical protein Mal65_02460 [Crateriforma conspicua]